MTSKFQQRHYEAIAELLQDAKNEAGYAMTGDGHMVNSHKMDVRLQGISIVEKALTDLFQLDNLMFDRGRFERACQPGANVGAR